MVSLNTTEQSTNKSNQTKQIEMTNQTLIDQTTNPPGTDNTADFTPTSTKYEYKGRMYMFEVWQADNGVTYFVEVDKLNGLLSRYEGN